MRGAPLTAYWADTREVLGHEERAKVLLMATLETLSETEVVLRDVSSHRLIIVTSKRPKELFCTLCKTEAVRERYGKTCPSFAKCAVAGAHKGNGKKV